MSVKFIDMDLNGDEQEEEEEAFYCITFDGFITRMDVGADKEKNLQAYGNYFTTYEAAEIQRNKEFWERKGPKF